MAAPLAASDPASDTVITGVLSAAAGVAALGLAYWGHRALNYWALNNNTPAKFDWDHEIVLVTGGAGGIGGETVQLLAKKGTTIVVLDVMPLTYTARQCLLDVICLVDADDGRI